MSNVIDECHLCSQRESMMEKNRAALMEDHLVKVVEKELY